MDVLYYVPCIALPATSFGFDQLWSSLHRPLLLQQIFWMRMLVPVAATTAHSGRR